MPAPTKQPEQAITPFDLVAADGESKTDEQINKLQEMLTRERDGRREDRFMFVAVATILLDICFFSVTNAGAAVGIILLEVIVLFILARRMGMDEVVEMLSALLRRAGDKGLDP